MPRFKNKTHAMNLRHIVWVCKTCEMHHDKIKLGLIRRPQICLSCRTEQDFYYFASRAEASRFAELRLQERSGLISDLKTQVVYPIDVNSIRISKYISDFVYKKNGEQIIEDVKGNKNFITDVFKLKRKLVEALYSVKIIIIER